MAKKKKLAEDRAEVHEELEGFNIRIDPFGNIKSNMEIEKIKDFLDSKIHDKKVHQAESSEEE